MPFTDLEKKFMPPKTGESSTIEQRDISDPEKLKLMHKFANKEFSPENILAHNDLKILVSKAPHLNEADLKAEINSFKTKYIDSASEHAVNLDSTFRNNFLKLADNTINIKSPDGIKALEEMKNALFSNLTDTHKRFAATPDYKNLGKVLQSVDNINKKIGSTVEDKLKAYQNLADKLGADGNNLLKEIVLDKKTELQNFVALQSTFSPNDLKFSGTDTEKAFLKDISGNTTGKLFQKFSEKEFSSENIDAFKEIKILVARAPNMNDADYKNELVKLQAKFFSSSADKEVNLKSTVQKEFGKLISGEYSPKSEQGINALKTLLTGIRENILDTYSRFIETDEYKKAKK